MQSYWTTETSQKWSTEISAHSSLCTALVLTRVLLKARIHLL